MIRFTRLTNAFSKKIENYCHVITYTSCIAISHAHKTLRVSPAMEVGLTIKLWSMEDLFKLAA